MVRLLLIAWRNLWRNKKRTMITIASIFFGVLLSTIMSSMQEGSYSSMIDNVVKFYSGYIQVHQKDYWENKTINNTFVPDDQLMKKIGDVQQITQIAPRLESFALSSSEEITKGCMVIGIDPETENNVTEIARWLKEGKYLEPGDSGVLLGSELASYLKLLVGDTLVMIGQGYHGVSAAGKYPVRGILKFPNPELDKQALYMDIRNCQDFFTADSRVTSLILMLESQYDLPAALHRLRAEISLPNRVMSWDEMQPEILQMIEADRSGAIIMKVILYILIGFGIFGTVLMMIVERRREMGVMIAIGMQRSILSQILLFETFYIGTLGVLSGFAGSIPIIAYLYHNPIPLTGDTARVMADMGLEPLIYFSWHSWVFIEQVIIVFIITMVISLYPVVSAKRLPVHLALKG